MSGFAVVLRRSGEPVPPPVVAALRRSLEHRAPDGVEIRERGNVAVIYGRLDATPEARCEQQPHECRDGNWLVSDARVDNRSELAAHPGPLRPLAGVTDVELLAACYERVGQDAPRHVLGDFAVVAIGPNGRITCFRDHLGVKPLHYWIGDEWVVVASELRQIAAHPDAPRSPNVGVLGEYLSGCPESTTETVLRGVCRLPAAHALVIDGGQARTWRYWTPPFDQRIELRSYDEYEERFLALLTEAVRCRMRAAGPVGTELSGGLDSTSVTALGQRLAGSGAVPATGVHAYSCLFPWSRDADERDHIQHAVDHLGVSWTGVTDDGDRPRWAWEDAAFWWDIPLPADGPAHVDVCRSARRDGCSVVLSGHGGDHWFDADPHALVELVQDGKLPAAWRMALRYARQGRRRALRRLLTDGIAPHGPSWLRHPRAPARAAAVIGVARAEARLDQRQEPFLLPREFRRLRAQRLFELCAGGLSAMSFGVFDRVAARAGVEYRHPYFDRRLVEFACQVPVPVHTTPSTNRRLQRGGLRDVLPPGTAARLSKAEFSDVTLRVAEQHLPEASWPDSEIVRRGWVDLAAARTTLASTRTALADRKSGGDTHFLWGMVQAEAVLRTVHANGRSPTAAVPVNSP